MPPQYILAVDAGTTGNRAFLFDRHGRVVTQAYRELTQHYPQSGWLEHDPIEIWQAVCTVMQAAIQTASISPAQIAAIGLTVQRETCLLWDKTTGKPLHNAIVWQDRRTADQCERLRQQGYSADIFDRTGLVIDAYFSATKLAWLLNRCEAVDRDTVLAGTIDTWLLWQLSGRRIHATDTSNASRTLLMTLQTGDWDQTLLDLFEIPRSILPSIRPSLSDFGSTDSTLLGATIPIAAILGDQQAALFGQGCDRPGLSKCTYGTGSFLVAHTGTEIVRSPRSLISTIAWSQPDRPLSYAIEGSMFTSGACIQWLRDGLGLIQSAADTEAIAQQVSDTNDVYFVPALSGLGAPHWDMNARGAFLGITGGTQRAHLVRAVLESIAFQVKEVVQAIGESGITVEKLRVDGGACQNDFLMQLQADLLGVPVERPQMRDTTVQGAAFAAGLSAGFWQDYSALMQARPIDRVFEPAREPAGFDRWLEAVERAKHWAE